MPFLETPKPASVTLSPFLHRFLHPLRTKLFRITAALIIYATIARYWWLALHPGEKDFSSWLVEIHIIIPPLILPFLLRPNWFGFSVTFVWAIFCVKNVLLMPLSALTQTGRYFLLDPYEIVWMIASDLIVFGFLAKAFLWPLRGKKKDIVERGKGRRNSKASH